MVKPKISYLEKDGFIVAQFIKFISESKCVAEVKIVAAGKTKKESQIELHRILQDLMHDEIGNAITELRTEIDN